MRKKTSLLVPILLAMTGTLLLLPGCLKDHVIANYKILTPVYELKTTAVANINGGQGTPISQPGQLYIKGSFIYLNEINKGIHVIDNSDPSHPVQTAFLNIPGNQNIGIRNNILYADMYGDVLAIDISNIHQVKVVGWLQNFFTSREVSGASDDYIVVSWSVKDTSFTVKPQGYLPIPGTNYYTYPGAVNDFYASSSTTLASSSSGVGTAGSTAVMVLVGDFLYAIPEQHSLGIIQVTDSTHPTAVLTNFAGDDLETIFPLQNNLLLGSKEGVYVYSISSPYQPVQVGEFKHGTACDPVVANSSYAYVTLHSGTTCGGAANELDILDAKNLLDVTQISSYPMTSPTGLGVDGSLLFVCDQSVVRVLDVSNPENAQQLSSVSVNQPSDVIAGNHLLLVVGSDGLYEFDYTDPKHVMQLSYLSINNSKS